MSSGEVSSGRMSGKGKSGFTLVKPLVKPLAVKKGKKKRRKEFKKYTKKLKSNDSEGILAAFTRGAEDHGIEWALLGLAVLAIPVGVAILAEYSSSRRSTSVDWAKLVELISPVILKAFRTVLRMH